MTEKKEVITAKLDASDLRIIEDMKRKVISGEIVREKHVSIYTAESAVAWAIEKMGLISVIPAIDFIVNPEVLYNLFVEEIEWLKKKK